MIPVECTDLEQKIGTTLVLIHEQEWYYTCIVNTVLWVAQNYVFLQVNVNL